MRKRKSIQRSTSFLLGVAGAIFQLAAAVLMVLGVGAASALHSASFAMYGAMLLFLATAERGKDKRGRRIKLLLLFVALLAAYTGLPPLTLLGALVIPLMSLLYWQPADKVRTILLTIVEILYIAADTLALANLFGAFTLQIVGGTLCLLAAARGAQIYNLYKRYKNIPNEDWNGEYKSLRRK